MVNEGTIPDERCEKYYHSQHQPNTVAALDKVQQQAQSVPTFTPVVKPSLVPFCSVRADDLRPQEMQAYETILKRFIEAKFPGMEFKFYISERNFDILEIVYPKVQEG